MAEILVVDDERVLRDGIKAVLSGEGFEVSTARDGDEALKKIAEKRPDLVLLDIMMPQMDGMTAMAKIRETSNVPIILLTAKSEDMDIILGLNIGADDYITKPFNPLEVAARVNSQLRRYTRLGAGEMRRELFTSGGIELNDETKTVLADGEPVSLTPKEYEILKLLISSPGKVYAPKEIYREVWNEIPLAGNDNTVAVHIRHLREKIEINPNEPRYIKVVFGQGYKFEKGREV